MCDINLITYLIAAAEISFGASIAFFSTAAGLNGDILKFTQAPIATTLAVVAIAGTVVFLTWAASAAMGCAGVCAAQTAKLRTDITAITSAISALTATIILAIVLESFPWAAKPTIAGIVVSLTIASIGFITLATDFAALSACATSGKPPPGSGIVTALSTYLAVGAGIAVILGVIGGLLPVTPQR